MYRLVVVVITEQLEPMLVNNNGNEADCMVTVPFCYVVVMLLCTRMQGRLSLTACQLVSYWYYSGCIVAGRCRRQSIIPDTRS